VRRMWLHHHSRLCPSTRRATSRKSRTEAGLRADAGRLGKSVWGVWECRSLVWETVKVNGAGGRRELVPSETQRVDQEHGPSPLMPAVGTTPRKWVFSVTSVSRRGLAG
jgi:hypothetical protein